jgi:hypothetical protein
VRITIELPDILLRQAKTAAARRRVSLKDFFAEAIWAKLQGKHTVACGQPWRKAPLAGCAIFGLKRGASSG